MDFRGISSQLMLMGTFPNEYKPVFQAFGHDYDPYSLATIGPFKADDGFPTQIKPVTRPDIEYVIPAGKVVTVKSIDKSADITIGGASEKIPVYGAGRESTRTRTYPSDTVADKDSWRGTDTIMGEIVPCAGWYNKGDDGSGSPLDVKTGWDYGYGLTSGTYKIFDNSTTLEYEVPPTLPIGIVIEPVRKWHNKTHLNYVDTPVYSVWRNGRLVLPFVDLQAFLNKFKDDLGITTSDANAHIRQYLSGYGIVPASDEASFIRAFAKISGLSTFIWGDLTSYIGTSGAFISDSDRYKLTYLIKPDVYGNYTMAWGIDASDDSPLDELFREHLIIGHLNYIETVHPRDLMQYIDTDPRILIGTSAGGIEPFLAYFMHDFLVIVDEEFGGGKIDEYYTRADKLAELVSDDNKIFGIADISLVFKY